MERIGGGRGSRRHRHRDCGRPRPDDAERTISELEAERACWERVARRLDAVLTRREPYLQEEVDERLASVQHSISLGPEAALEELSRIL